MPALTNEKGLKKVLLPEATAHSVSRELKLTEDQLAKLQSALDNKLPLKMAIGLRSKLWAVVDGTDAKMTMVAREAAEGEVGSGDGDGDDEIVDEDLTPPDDGEEIPEEEEEEEEEQEMSLERTSDMTLERAVPVRSPRGRKLVGATIKIYAVAVFHPHFRKSR
jgi:hypothetical protein